MTRLHSRCVLGMKLNSYVNRVKKSILDLKQNGKLFQF